MPGRPPPPPSGRLRFTSVASWRGAYGPVDYDGHRYGLRVHQFRRFAELPRLAGARFELALDIHPDERDDLALLRGGGWALVDPSRGGGDARRATARYLQGSGAELMVAKGMYVDSRSGWFSERSICYLARGRPVLAQDTGFGELLPGGRGPARVLDARRGRRRRRGDPRATTARHAARGARAGRGALRLRPRARRGCSTGRAVAAMTTVVVARRARQQAPPRRQRVGAA